jgi:hypothetical protein
MKNLFFSLLLGLVPLISTAQTITTSAITGGPFCPGSTINVNYTIDESGGSFVTGNDFIAELSDASGLFTGGEVTIGTLNNTTIAGSITSIIPGGTADGSAYLVRVRSNTPPVDGSAVSLVVSALTATAVQDSPVVCFGEANGVATVTPVGGNGSYTYAWDQRGNRYPCRW